MKKLVLVIVAALAGMLNMPAQLSGNAFLSGQNDHSGIKVKFNAHPGTAISDSAVTGMSGSYSISITGGVYDVVFSKAGYVPVAYNNGATSVLTNTVALNSVSLTPGNAVFVSGTVSGVWASNNVYLVNGDITIPAGNTLVIQPGTTIKFNGNYSLTANGILTAAGSQANPIVFTSNLSPAAPGDWKSIQINNSSSAIDNCIVEYAMEGVNCTGYSPTISNSKFREISVRGIYCSNCQPHIVNNEIYNIKGPSAVIGIWVELTSGSGVIECNHIHHCISSAYNAYGIISGSNDLKNNTIHDINGGVGKGIDARGAGLKIENNYLYNCTSGINLAPNWPPSTGAPLVVNNTIHSGNTGIYVDGSGGAPGYSPAIVNNIIIGNTYGIYQSGSAPSAYNISYNLVWNNASGNYSNVQVTGVGQMVGNNQQGNPIDSYFNLSQDPLFAGNTPPTLTPNSPCINAGKPQYATDMGYKQAQCEEMVVGIASHTKSMLSSRLFPNPNSGSFQLEIDKEIPNAKLMIMNTIGQIVYSQAVSQGLNEIHARGLDSGLYCYSILQNTTVLKSGKIAIE